MRTALVVLGALLLSPLAAAQQPSDPTVNDSDFNTTPPAADDSYMNDTNASSSNSTTDPTVSNSDFDTSAPPADTSYLDQTASQYGVDNGSASSSGAASTSGAAKTPAPALGIVLVGVLVAAAFVRRRRRSD